MDLCNERQHLVEAERHIALGEQHIARQVQIIDKLARGGHDIELAVDLLATYRDMQVSHRQHRDHILEAIEQMTEPRAFRERP